MPKLWNPETALRRAEHTHIGAHHIAVRQQNVESISKATYDAITKACSQGKPLPKRPPQVTGFWTGCLWTYPDDMSKDWATLYLLQATRMSNLPQDAISSFDRDLAQLSKGQMRGVIPTIVITEVSHTMRWEDINKKIVDDAFYDPSGPDNVQKLALERGITVFRTSQYDLAESIKTMLIELHLGKTPHQLLIP